VAEQSPRDGRNRRLGFATRAIHHGYDPAEAQGALTPPVYMTSTYAFASAEAGSALFRGEAEGYIYGRTKNPTQDLLERRLAELEGAEAALVLASGMAAVTTTVWTLVGQGDEVVIDHTLYGSTFAFFMRGLSRFGVAVHPVDMSDPGALHAALGPRSRACFLETPANPNLRVLDIAGIAEAAHAVGAVVIVDNTFATPALQQPLAHGADLVVHSATKYLGGHGDLLAGAVVGPAELVKRIRVEGLRTLTGATVAPLTAFLVLRGLKTLELRMARHCAAARAAAELLAAHPAVAWTAYPGLKGSPGHTVARRQMADFGGLVAFELRGGREAGFRFMDRLQLVTRAVSLGDAESLIQHPASMTHSTYSPEERARHGITEGLLRLSLGLESIQDILDDLAQALDAAS
jgi:methionine-gamma-lyase